MKRICIVLSCLIAIVSLSRADIITPYKYTDQERESGLSYTAPQSSCLILQRKTDSSSIVCYYSTPHTRQFPIAILCGGSSSRNDIISIVHFHRYFLKEFLDLGCAVITVEQQGVDGNKINVDEFIEHYTRSARLKDHCAIIDSFNDNPPAGWNGKLIYLGVSEGGPIVTSLTERYADQTIATINWAGAGDWSWPDELWAFINNLVNRVPWHFKMRMYLPKWMPFSLNLPRTRKEFDLEIGQALQEPVWTKEFLGMSYKYHADACLFYPKHNYHDLKTPFLIVAGAQDSIVESCDKFVQKAKEAGAPITYTRVDDMDHYIRKRPEIIEQSFDWLAHILIDSHAH